MSAVSSSIGAPVEVRMMVRSGGVVREEMVSALVVSERPGSVTVKRFGNKRFFDGAELMALPLPPQPHMWRFK